jgi:hypothetical protein
MQARLRRLRRWFDRWLECRQHRCTYYLHYLAWGPNEMGHEAWHHVETQAVEHFRSCTWTHETGICPRCSLWERRTRA